MSFLRMTNGHVYLHYWLGDNARFKISTKLKVDKSKWNEKRGRAKSDKLTYDGKRVNAVLIQYEEVLQKVLLHCENNDCLTLENFRKKFREELGRPIIKKRRKTISRNKSFITFLKEVIKEYEAKGSRTGKSYQTTLNVVLEYAQGKDISFDQIDSKFYIEFNKFLESKNFSVNYIDKHWKNIKAAMNKSFSLKMHNNEEYKGFKRVTEDADDIYLTFEEIEQIENLDLNGIDEIVRDYFIISCYTGLRYSDWDKVDAKNIKDGVLTIRAFKTKEIAHIPISDNVMEILNKYNGKLPKTPTDVTVNKKLKKIGELACIDDTTSKRITKGGHAVTHKKKKYELITSHTGRRSFVTNLILKKVPSQIIMKITGHKDLDTFQTYIKFDDLVAAKQLQELDIFK